MFRKLTIKQNMIAGILIGCLIPFILGSLIIINQTEKWLYRNYVNNTNLILIQAANHVDESLDHMKDFAASLANDTRIQSADSNITSYVSFDPLAPKPEISETEKDIFEMFRTAVEVENDFLSFLALGTEEGGYVEYPEFHPTKPYDPRVRGWYKNAMAAEAPVISEPYQMQVSKDLVISIDQRVLKDDRSTGVISLTVSLDKIMQKIKEIHFQDAGSIMILSPNNVFINSANHEEWLMKSVDDLGLDIFNDVDRYNGKYFEQKLDGTDMVFTVYVSPESGWKYISIIDKSIVLEHSKALSEMLGYIILATIFVVLTLLFSISDKITKPIRDLTLSIKRMATFHFDAYEQKDFKEYTRHNSEIGEISRAISTMQDNFLELKNKIGAMDEQIKSISIDDKSVHQLNLSSDNPFAGIAGSVNGLLARVYSYIRQIRQYGEEIKYLAEHDSLTNLPNRRSFHENLNRELAAGLTGAVILLDIDNFKSINDSLGHVFGDKVLQYVAEMLRTIDSFVYVSRFGGDEFLILYPFKEQKEELEAYVKEIFHLFSKSLSIEENEVKIEFSIGICVFPYDSDNIDQIIMNADMALHHVKNSGKSNFAYFNQVMSNYLKFRITVKNLLVKALEEDGFYMVYQPVVNLETGCVVGHEALVRLKNHEISPVDFIRIAEENGLIIPLGRLITRMVIEQVAAWDRMGLDPKAVSINFSALQINDRGYRSYLLDLLKENDVSGERIIIEITEHIFMENKEATVEFINGLKNYGIRFAIDDFGAEFSSLNYLAALPIDVLKIDRELNQRFLEFDDVQVIQSLIEFIHRLKLKVVAEGIEEASQMEKLLAAGCDHIQGFYFSKPLDAKSVEENYNKNYMKNKAMQ